MRSFTIKDKEYAKYIIKIIIVIIYHMSSIQRSVFPFGPTIMDAYNISTNGTGAFGDNSNNLLINFTPSKDSAQLGVKGNINSVGTYFSNSITSIRIPADSSANRPPQGLRGYIRYNTDLSQNNIEYYNGFVPAWQQLSTPIYFQSVINKAPTIQTFLIPGYPTYTPSSGVLYIKIRMVGGGGGGGGSGTNVGTIHQGRDGSACLFPFSSTLFTAGGGPGAGLNTSATNGGSGTITGGYQGFTITGGQGSGSPGYNTSALQPGGMGGSSAFGGNGGDAGGTNPPLNGGNGVLGGGGGGGATYAGTGGDFTGPGGGAGGYVEVYYPNPNPAGIVMQVGTGGPGGAAATPSPGAISGAGGSGGAGAIIIEEYYH